MAPKFPVVNAIEEIIVIIIIIIIIIPRPLDIFLSASLSGEHTHSVSIFLLFSAHIPYRKGNFFNEPAFFLQKLSCYKVIFKLNGV